MFKIDFIVDDQVSLTPEFDDISKMIQRLEEISNQVCENILSTNAEVLCTLELTTSRKVKNLNSEYRKIDKDTDVLSFPLFDDLRNDSSEVQYFQVIELGDIIISWDKLTEQALEYNISNLDEFIHLYVHGFFHLLGFDHELSLNEALLMQKNETNFIESI